MSKNSAAILLAALDARRILAIDGPNFSGRSSLLRKFCRVTADGRMYLGPEVYFALSGLTTTVRQELELHAGGPLDSAANAAAGAIETLGLSKLFEQHPARLSGGEQTCLAVVCAMILKPKILAADCALEQLDSHKLQTVLDLLQSSAGPTQASVITDNRLDEWNIAERSAAIQSIPIASLEPDPSRHAPVAPLDPKQIDRLPAVTAPAIELQNISAGYAKKSDVLTGVSLTLAPGRVYTLVGANGSGKSTLAKILSGVLKPTAGQILVSGTPANLWKTPGKVAGYHLQNPDVGLFEATVAAELGLKNSTPPADSPAAIVGDAFGLRTFFPSNPLALPFPIRKRVSLAATISRLPPWIILDEPTLGADAATIRALSEIIRALAGKQHGLIVISHSRKLLEMLSGHELKIENNHVSPAQT